ncbi:MAG: acyl-CoA thioesterase [Ardenticatenia bacterium]|nr:acyl-CoA thioesterase [Ardenticatenia bacterium]
MSATRRGKRPSDSAITIARQMIPSDANPLGIVHGGEIMKMVDEAGGLAAMRHAGSPVVTVRLDSMTFLEPIYVGDLVIAKAMVNWVGRTSVEVGVRVEAQNPITGVRTHTNSAFAVYVALDDEGHPRPVPPLLLETDEEKRRWAEAEQRQRHRLAQRKRKRPTGQPPGA